MERISFLWKFLMSYIDDRIAGQASPDKGREPGHRQYGKTERCSLA
jgi:hypothetical protein